MTFFYRSCAGTLFHLCVRIAAASDTVPFRNTQFRSIRNTRHNGHREKGTIVGPVHVPLIKSGPGYQRNFEIGRILHLKS